MFKSSSKIEGESTSILINPKRGERKTDTPKILVFKGQRSTKGDPKIKFAQKVQSPRSQYKSTKHKEKVQSPMLKPNKIPGKPPYMNHKKFQQTLFQMEASQWVIDVVERNQTYQCNLIHFLLPYALILMEVHTLHQHHHYLIKVFHFVLKKIAKPEIQKQLQKNTSVKYIAFLTNFRKAEREETLNILRNFMVDEGELIKAVCPYYYNLFVMVCNKEMDFGGQRQASMLEYTVEFKCSTYNSFDRQDIRKQLCLLQKALANKYHSPGI